MISNRTARKNIRNVLGQASPVEITEGRAAYELYNKTLQEIAQTFELSLSRVAGAFSALSPNSDYQGNLRSLLTLCMGFKGGMQEADCTVSTYNTNRAKAWRLLQGEDFNTVYKGLKVRSFYRNLIEPDHPRAITIDGHMVNVFRGEVHVMSNSGITPRQYEHIAGNYRLIARQQGLLPCQLQAILWLVWKRLHRIKVGDFDPFQGVLFEEENRCRIYVPVETIKPYDFKREYYGQFLANE